VPAIPTMPQPETVPPRAVAGAETLRLIVGSTIFSGGGTMAHDERMGELRTPPRATIHPQTAAALKLSRGDVIDVAAPGGARLDGLAVAFDPHVPPNAVVLVDGLPAAPLNALGGALSVHVVAKVRA
jgi:anaerobic selenocysteine-containing dehydrogenase